MKITEKKQIEQMLAQYPSLEANPHWSQEICAGRHCSILAKYTFSRGLGPEKRNERISVELYENVEVQILSKIDKNQIHEQHKVYMLFKELWAIKKQLTIENFEHIVELFDATAEKILNKIKYVSIYQARGRKKITEYQKDTVQVSTNIFFHVIEIYSIYEYKELKSVVYHHPKSDIKFYASKEDAFRGFMKQQWPDCNVLFFDNTFASVKVPNDKKGLFIGRRGDNINVLSNMFDIKIKVV